MAEVVRPDGTPPVSVLICTLNEAMNLPNVLPLIPKWVDEVMIVDGGSTDDTVAVAHSLRPDARILTQPGKGKGIALRYGVEQAQGEIIVTLDADGQTNPEEMALFLAPLVNGGFEFAKGTRFAEGRPPNMPRHRWFGNKVLAMTSNLLFGTHYSDVCSGYNAFYKRSFQRLNLTYDRFEMEQEMAVKVKKAGLRVTEVPHRDPGRLGGESKTKDIRQGFTDWFVIIRERFRGGAVRLGAADGSS